MGSLVTTYVIALLLSVAAAAALGGAIASAVVQRRGRRRTRRAFLAGFICGALTGRFVRGRQRGLRALTAIARNDRSSWHSLVSAEVQRRLRVPPPVVRRRAKVR